MSRAPCWSVPVIGPETRQLGAQLGLWKGPAATADDAIARARALTGMAWTIRTGRPFDGTLSLPGLGGSSDPWGHPIRFGPAAGDSEEAESLELRQPFLARAKGGATAKLDDVVRTARALARLAAPHVPAAAVLAAIETTAATGHGLSNPHRGSALVREADGQPDRFPRPPALSAAAIALSVAGSDHRRRIAIATLGTSATERAARRLGILSTREADARTVASFLEGIGLAEEARAVLRRCAGA